MMRRATLLAVLALAAFAAAAAARPGTKIAMTGTLSGSFGALASYQHSPSPQCNVARERHAFTLIALGRKRGHVLYLNVDIETFHGRGTYRFDASSNSGVEMTPVAGTHPPPPYGDDFRTAASPQSVFKVARGARSGTMDLFLTTRDDPSAAVELRGRWACRLARRA